MPPAVADASYGPRQAQPLDTFSAEVGSVAEVLKGLFEPPSNDENERWQEELERVAGAYARVFASADGVTILDHLADNTVRKPTFFAHLGYPVDQLAMLGAQREGCNALFYFIIRMIALGRQQKPPQREGS